MATKTSPEKILADKAKAKEEAAREIDMVERLATSNYQEVLLQSTERENAPQHIQINEYNVRIPRDEPVLLAEPLVKIMIRSSTQIMRYDSFDPNEASKKVKKTTRRHDLPFQAMGGLISPLAADKIRQEGKQKVYPERLNARAKAALKELAAKK